MKSITLLPADKNTIINRTIITEEDTNNLVSLYEPIIGPLAVSLYFTFLRDLHRASIISVDYTHHHLMSIMQSSIDTIKLARESLEGVGLIKTYYKEGTINSYVYELYSPLTPKEFFASPIFNIALYNNLGKYEYEMLVAEYQLPKIDLKEYEDVSIELNNTYESSSNFEPIDAVSRKTTSIKLENKIDFDLLLSSIPKGILNERALTKKSKELIEQLAFIYDLDTMKMVEILRTTITDKGTFDKEELRKSARKYYQYNNSGKLPTIVYRTQPEYLKTPEGDNSPLGQIIYMFENTSPRDFLQIKYHGAEPTNSDLKLIETLCIDQELEPAVVNVLLDYVLKKNNNKLPKAFIEAIAGQWKRLGIKTAKEAMELAKKENSKYNKKIETKTNSKKLGDPIWFNQTIEKAEKTEEEQRELDELLKDFR